MNFKSLPQLLDYFKDEATCIAYYEKLRWHGKPVCPHCGAENPYKIENDKRYKCSNNECYKKFTVKVGTIFENSKIPFRIWLAAIFICTTSKKGVSSLQLSRQLGITQTTAWFLLHRIREMLKLQAPAMVGGIGGTGMVETDETYIGGKEKNKHKDKRSKDENGAYVNNKSMVVGVIERSGKVILKHIPAATTENMVGFIKQHVPEGATIFTDEHQAYRNLGKIYTHDTINHSIKLYVDGEVHTNTIENFWSILKRGIYGIYHNVSEKHLDRYLNEFASRFNERHNSNQGRLEKFLAKSESRLTYNALIANK